MVLHLPEYTEQNPRKGDILNYYDKLPEYLHKMSAEDIVSHINRNGERSRLIQQSAITSYFVWLNQNYDVDVVDNFFKLKQILANNNSSFVGFYSLKEMHQAISEAETTIEATGTNNADWAGLYALFYLEWYGILPESAITIKLTDVSDDGKKVYIPAEDRTIEIDNVTVANYFAEYKQKTGYQRPPAKEETPYTQNTFYRNTARRGEEITEKTIYNIRQKFVRNCEDERFAKKSIYYSGRYAEMLKAELELGREFSGSDEESCKLLNNIFNTEMSYNVIAAIIRGYKVYKQKYMERQ